MKYGKIFPNFNELKYGDGVNALGSYTNIVEEGNPQSASQDSRHYQIQGFGSQNKGPEKQAEFSIFENARSYVMS